MTGKALVPVVHDGGDRWHGTLQEQRRELTGEDEVAAFEQDVIRRGYYPFRTTPDELAELEADSERLDDLFHEPDARDGRAVDGDGRGEARRPAAAGVRVPRQRRPVRGRRDPRRGHPGRARRGPGRRGRRLPDGVDRLVERDAVEHLPRGARGCPARADPGRHVAAHQPARAGDPEPALPAVRLRPRRRARPQRGPEAQARRPRARAGRLEGGARGDRGDPAGALAARPHPRGPRPRPHRRHPLHQPRERIRAGRAARRPDRAVRQEGQELRADVAARKGGALAAQTRQWSARCSCARPRAW